MLNPHCLLCLVSHFNYFSTTIQRFGEHSSKVFKDENGWKRACALPRWSSQVDVLTTMIRTTAHNFKDKLINLCGNEHQRANTQGRAPPPFSAWCISPDLTPKRFFSTPMHCNDEWDMSDVCSHFDLILQWLNICLPGDQHCPVTQEHHWPNWRF